MVKKIIHIADLHIRTNQYHDLYKKQFQTFIDDIAEQTEGISQDDIRIVIAGDLFHQKIVVSNEQLLLGAWFLNKLSELGIVIIIPGNHDFLEKNQERIDSITPIVKLINNIDIVYYKNSGIYLDDGIKWVVYSLYQHNQRPDFKREDNDKDLYVGLFHGSVQGMSTDLGFTFDDAYDKLNFNGLDIVMCGDIHRRQLLFLNREIEIDEDDVEKYLKDGWSVSF